MSLLAAAAVRTSSAAPLAAFMYRSSSASVKGDGGQREAGWSGRRWEASVRGGKARGGGKATCKKVALPHMIGGGWGRQDGVGDSGERGHDNARGGNKAKCKSVGKSNEGRGRGGGGAEWSGRQ